MESIQELQNKKRKLEQLLKGLEIPKHTTQQYDYERGEVYGESQQYVLYSDPALANYYRNEITVLEQKIKNYGAYLKEEQDQIKFNSELTKEVTEGYIQSEASKKYEKAQEEYHQKGFIGKTVALFTGKKPKKQEYYYKMEKQAFNEEIKDKKIAEIDSQIIAWESMRGKYKDIVIDSSVEALKEEKEKLLNNNVSKGAR